MSVTKQSLLNETHNPQLSSWLDSANLPNTDFPIQNLPFAIFRVAGSEQAFRGGVAIGDQIIDLAALSKLKLFDGVIAEALVACSQSTLNDFMAMPASVWSALRAALSQALSAGAELEGELRRCLVAQDEAEYDLPCRIGDYTDFYTSIHHATSVGSLFRPDNPLLPNYKWVPIGYHGRSSSIGISGQAFPRPKGQTKAPDADSPSVGPCKRLDYEMEVGIYIGGGNELGETIALDDTDQHIFGMCLFNDWSARDIQAWEYQPLGPFLAKNFASTVSPWIVTNEALAPFRTSWQRNEADPQPLEYLSSERNSALGSYDVQLEVFLETPTLREAGEAAVKLTQSSFRHSYWTTAQMVAHHTVNGCNLVAGDFFGSGTQSGPDAQEAGSLLELSNGGKQQVELANGETRTFLEDGDAVVMRGYCEQAGAKRIGFGECYSLVLPAKS
ncbi:fumarylacetoacetase [Psychrobium sp. 1_MG-2023]|uniref:fumarylacetoacetase n=1 Tax=Psychrobium sp. 1_MG-2023 TaxID=3062624 RepID=UPI000C34B505|nr:fumarylacetoacetase [Psychrobium sp. 1_MG-2023]MDP2562875.1 fumarylacetoacetase [Psychrobium sp. 1_MG-2023]PKF57148.1 fumarylacetoacetase [Alteromonadales bacterium alter-6D02]